MNSGRNSNIDNTIRALLCTCWGLTALLPGVLMTYTSLNLGSGDIDKTNLETKFISLFF